ncbi:uncharacterized protein ACLA_060830 [Aspergillus clavatus NRRL 1]|uniref:Uncharacterized protein n=1 Tax=Aspergillus clavatus (strain ATCC 1007 / CBS 513.65 / DSM 816 / NCTC 3887 / NRRL 1 / QM 1276 / 107) TaxID=344612 RepID=A1CC67_ASPCL|nr:uncharacterized protein ACLA_060830 [Aspergillus clavatus NRRL 1]EAW12124.1 hypothetical protein ACLA_060830 [Aspergillus clavatus NRRL 1]
MITAIRSLAGRLNRARTGNNKAGPAEVIRNLNEIYCLIENYESAHLDADSLSAMRINCEDLILASDGSYVNSGHPVFFQPLPLARLPPPHPNDTLTQRELAVWTRCFDGVSLYERTPRDSAEFLSAVMQWHFTAFRRDVPGTKRLRPSLMEMTRWFPVDFYPYIFKDEFTELIFNSLIWAPGDAWTTGSGLSHAMFTLVIGQEPDERLLRAEALAIIAAIITRLSDPAYKRQCVVPVMVFSLLGDRKARILQAYNNSEGIMIRKSSTYSFSSPVEAKRNVDLFMQFMASEPVGDTFHLQSSSGIIDNIAQPNSSPTSLEPSGIAASDEYSADQVPSARRPLSHFENVKWGKMLSSIGSRAQLIFAGRANRQAAASTELPHIPPFAFEVSPETPFLEMGLICSGER